MLNDFSTPVALQIPPDARANGFYASPCLADAFANSLSADAVASPKQLARYVFENQPAWVDTLIAPLHRQVVQAGLSRATKLGWLRVADAKTL